jgi:enamine deaminase RidA (YjgF/YER057c/UK114 family)
MGEPGMAIKFHNPKTVSFAGKYSLGAEVPAGARLYYVSGQVGVGPAGKLQPTFEKQAAQVWKNIREVLKSGGMTFRNIVKVNIFLTDSRYIAPYREIRDRFIKAPPYPASTLLIVQGLADPAMLLEVEVVAAK